MLADNLVLTQSEQLLASYVDIINEKGPDSPQAQAFVEQHLDLEEFVELAEIARQMKIAMTATPNSCGFSRF